MLHLRGIKEVTPCDLLLAARKESFIMKGAPLDADIEELLKEEVQEMTAVQENTMRNLLKELCYHVAWIYCSLDSTSMRSLWRTRGMVSEFSKMDPRWVLGRRIEW